MHLSSYFCCTYLSPLIRGRRNGVSLLDIIRLFVRMTTFIPKELLRTWQFTQFWPKRCPHALGRNALLMLSSGLIILASKTKISHQTKRTALKGIRHQKVPVCSHHCPRHDALAVLGVVAYSLPPQTPWICNDNCAIGQLKTERISWQLIKRQKGWWRQRCRRFIDLCELHIVCGTIRTNWKNACVHTIQ